MGNIISGILNMTAWRMETPQLFGAFHIIASLLAAALAVIAAVFFARRITDEKRVRKILMSTGWILVALEVYKQLFLFFVVNDGAFDWWFFPFQLCSVPMYLCILLPLLYEGNRSVFMTFMGSYTFVSAVAALVYPADILRSYTVLTIHGFMWHGLLLFISLLIIFTGSMDTSIDGLRSTASLFSALCVIALVINAMAEPAMPAIRAAHPAVTHNWAAMFYLNPYHISPQPLVGTVQEAAGIPAGLILYAAVVVIVSSIAGRLLSHLLILDGRPRS